jgi:hypothetical protein
MKKFVIIIILIIVLLLSSRYVFNTVSTKHCGVERWSVKTLTDEDTAKINFKDTLKTTVAAQCMIKPPRKITKQLYRQEEECHLLTLDCYIIKYKKEDDDNDFHVVIGDIESDKTMIAEIPSPLECPEIKASGHYNDMIKVRKWFEENIGIPTDRFTKCNSSARVRITGIGFFDFNHGQTGRAPNGREIHPVLKMEFLK